MNRGGGRRFPVWRFQPDERLRRAYLDDTDLFELVTDPNEKYARYMEEYRPFMAEGFARAQTEQERRLIRIEICRRVFAKIIMEVLASRQIPIPPTPENQRGPG
ncbi:unnamed protein product [Spodoptera exigua]|nr:unnamed protein product [Spodoptera exigua]